MEALPYQGRDSPSPKYTIISQSLVVYEKNGKLIILLQPSFAEKIFLVNQMEPLQSIFVILIFPKESSIHNILDYLEEYKDKESEK